MSTTAQNSRVGIGVVLPNGWTVVDVWHDTSQERFGDMRPQGIVLAMNAAHEYDPFATWQFFSDERGILTVSGYYFHSIYPASRDFGRRIGTQEA